MLNYFNFEEFDSPDEIGSGLPKCQNGKMDLGFLHKLDEARAIADTPFVITSGYRTPEHNAKVGGRIGSSHLKGFAVDISCTTSVQRTAIIQGLIKTGFTRIGIGKTFIHVDLDNNKQSAIWLY
tara:strand:- start:495 stop:866 length:372 start_codon:yes stop_codon:yes gene_type:complete